jgi:hypothetical protein
MQMIEPVILTDAILAAAVRVAGRYRECWDDPEAIHVCDEDLVSPIDGKTRRVRFLLGQALTTKGKTVCDVRDQNGDIVGVGNTVALSEELIRVNDPFMAILLHEIIHAVDPVFEEESRVFNSGEGPRPKLTHSEECRILHEQRAFPGMWILRVLEDLVEGVYAGPEASVAKYRQECPEFDWFCRATPDLMAQTHEHIRLIAESLRSRLLTSPSSS